MHAFPGSVSLGEARHDRGEPRHGQGTGCPKSPRLRRVAGETPGSRKDAPIPGSQPAFGSGSAGLGLAQRDGSGSRRVGCIRRSATALWRESGSGLLGCAGGTARCAHASIGRVSSNGPERRDHPPMTPDPRATGSPTASTRGEYGAAPGPRATGPPLVGCTPSLQAHVSLDKPRSCMEQSIRCRLAPCRDGPMRRGAGSGRAGSEGLGRGRGTGAGSSHGFIP